MQPIVQKEFYLAKAAGLYAGEVPDPVSTTDYYYAALCGKYVGELPEPVTAEQKYLANLLGKDVAVPEPITLDDIFMYDAVMRIVEEEPTTRKQYYWILIAKSRQYVEKTASGNPITLTDSAENKPLGMTLYGRSKQDGTPSPENPVEIESAGGDGKIGVSVRGKNLFHVQETNMKKAISWGATAGTKITIVSNRNYSSIAIMNVLPNVTYFIKNFTPEKFSVTRVLEADENEIGYVNYKHSDNALIQRIIRTSGNTTKMYLVVETIDGTAFTEDMLNDIKIMVAQSDVEESYEPYRTPQSTSLITPNGLPGIPVPSGTSGITYTDANGQAWIADEIDFSKGKYIQNVGKVDFENLLWKLIGNCFRSEAISDSKVYKWTSEIANIICSHYICKMTSYNMQYNSGGQDNLIGMYVNQIEIKDTRYNNDVDLFKQSLSGVYAYYVLAIPVERNLTSAELAEYTQLYSYKPTTVMENDSDCWMDVTALCKPK